eukprot:1346570-Rhodomonas_salina.2
MSGTEIGYGQVVPNVEVPGCVDRSPRPRVPGIMSAAIKCILPHARHKLYSQSAIVHLIPYGGFAA